MSTDPGSRGLMCYWCCCSRVLIGGRYELDIPTTDIDIATISRHLWFGLAILSKSKSMDTGSGQDLFRGPSMAGA